MSRLRLWWLDHRLDRIWRQGLADPVLSALRARTGSTLLASARTAGTDPICVAEIVWGDGFCVRVGACHPGAVADLARFLSDGRAVTLTRAARSGQLWILDFAIGDRPFPLLAGAITFAPGGGDAAPSVTPLVWQDA